MQNWFQRWKFHVILFFFRTILHCSRQSFDVRLIGEYNSINTYLYAKCFIQIQFANRGKKSIVWVPLGDFVISQFTASKLNFTEMENEQISLNTKWIQSMNRIRFSNNQWIREIENVNEQKKIGEKFEPQKIYSNLSASQMIKVFD